MKGQGYLYLDARASDGALEEYDTEQCPHCERIMRIAKHTIHAEAFCTRCHHRVCPDGPCVTSCTPFLRRLDPPGWMLREAIELQEGVR